MGDLYNTRPYVRILIVVLVLNLLFWMVVILWRVYILKRARDQIRRQRRQAAEAFSNPTLVTCEGTGALSTAASRNVRDRPFVLATPRNELPPPYDEAIKYPSLDWTNSGSCELPTLGATVSDSGGGPAPPPATQSAQQQQQQQQQPSESRPPVPPRPSRPPSARPSVQVDVTPASDTVTLPTYEELQRRGTLPSPEILLTVSSHVRNQSA